ncbi:oxidoreductase [Shewanella sp. VB17]|uniref:oxidoreductase n=1 Tax=Shewanella sp. VB17 TaxID=2739432 RepID=UPI0015632F9D|nr:oxidoreductase [Shewanella sp. VB17]NRD72848.1 oxidoreductase [Shewanella sp. VB17]
MIKVGVVGYGYSANTFHIPLIESTVSMRLTGISSTKSSIVKVSHPSVTLFDSADKLITSGNIDLVIITAPNHVHFRLAKLCLESGVHVVVEKPMVTTSAEAQELVSIAKKRALVLSVFHNRRWDGDFLTVQKLLKNNSLGEIKYFESHYDRFRPTVRQRWREEPGPGSGIWYDLGSHLVDQTITLFGLPQALTARCLSLRNASKTTDYFHVQLHYSEHEVVLHASSFTAAPNSRFRLEGSKGSFIKYGFDPQEKQLQNGLMPDQLGYGVEEKAQYGSLYGETSVEPIETEMGCYQQYYQGIASAINIGSRNPVNPIDAVNVLTILELAEMSSRERKTLPVWGHKR